MKPKQLCYNCKHFECIEKHQWRKPNAEVEQAQSMLRRSPLPPKDNGAFCRCLRVNDPNVGAWRCKYYQHVNDKRKTCK